MNALHDRLLCEFQKARGKGLVVLLGGRTYAAFSLIVDGSRGAQEAAVIREKLVGECLQRMLDVLVTIRIHDRSEASVDETHLTHVGIVAEQ